MDIEVEADASLQLAMNTALNSRKRGIAVVTEELKTPVWKLNQFTKKHKQVHLIKHHTWKQVKPFRKLDNIELQLDSAKFQLLWSKFTTDEFSLDLPVVKIKDFVSALLMNQEDWTRSIDARFVYHRLFCAVSRTSPEIFVGDWKRTG